MPSEQRPFADLEQRLSLHFREQRLLEQAFVHRSYLNEHPEFPIHHNERLEFLGDAVLELIVTEYLYETYPDAPEGDLTNWRASLVNSDTLGTIATELGLETYLYLSRGERKDQNRRARQTILANAFEALVGAIYLDQSYATAKQFIATHVLPRLPYILEHKLYLDPKTRFQELAQERHGITPTYRVIEERGPDHAKEFHIGVYLEETLIGSGHGASKQEAQERAAAQALEKTEQPTPPHAA
ncbi:MAG: ribonuclease III [Candidatus Kerfeldbacteria bacterium]|nr:ribonuclease III [Candidatus Kerfeldbacteria bacterium]